MVRTKRKQQPLETINNPSNSKNARQTRYGKLREKKRKLEPEDNSNQENLIKKQCLYIEVAHPYLYSSHGMVSFTPEYIQHLKQSYIERSYHGAPNYTCKYCDAMFWYDERNKTDSTKKKQILYSNCCKYGEIKNTTI